MHHYRQAIHRMRLGQSDRAIAKSKLIGRTKCAAVQALAAQNGWLSSAALPDDEQLVAVLEVHRSCNSNQPPVTQPHAERIKQWVEKNFSQVFYKPPGGFGQVVGHLVRSWSGQIDGSSQYCGLTKAFSS